MNGSILIVKVLFFVLVLYAEALGSHYTDLWAVHIVGGEEVALKVADRHGFIYRGKIMPDYYHFQHRKVAKRSTFASTYYHRPLADDNEVLWLEQQVAKIRRKRSAYLFNDPKWPLMWYLNRGRGLDMNVHKAWEMGYTGKGVVVTILDDGIEKDHPDLMTNYDPGASYDVNGHDPDPQPRYDLYNENRHGTRCAGEVAAESNNNFCSVGVAFNASIGGVRMLDGDVTDSVEAQSLGLNPQHIHIYSASWGPDDDGRTVDGPATLARKAFYDGITKGRDNLGSIFVWASGNGGRDSDNCNCDGYTNSIYTLSISSATQNGDVPWYSEACSATLATTYSSGSQEEKQIVTTDIRRGCTVNHTGTSASAPLAAGLIALALQANPSLSWRDMQHIVVETAKPSNLNRKGWTTNGVGKKVSHSFGFGLMDAAAMVSLARNWTRVPEQHICEIRSMDHNGRTIGTNGKISVHLYTDGCEGTANYVKYLEHVQARITMTSSRRGEIRITLSSPTGTVSTLMDKRPRDNSREGFNNWAFMTTHNWGESAKGQWTLTIENGATGSYRPVKLRDWVLVLYGTDSPPKKSRTSPRSPKPFNEKRVQPDRYPFLPPSFSNSQDWSNTHRNNGFDNHNNNKDNDGFHQNGNYNRYHKPHYPYHPPLRTYRPTINRPVPASTNSTTTATTTTTSTTTTTTPQRHVPLPRDHNQNHYYRWMARQGYHSGMWPPPASLDTTNYRKGSGSSHFLNPGYDTFAPSFRSYGYSIHDTSSFHRNHHPEHTCVYETLAKKSNMSAIQYVRKKRPELTAAELKKWTLVMMGTQSQSQGGPHGPAGNGRPNDQPSNSLNNNNNNNDANSNSGGGSGSSSALSCAGVTTNGICIECKPGFFKLGDNCVPRCPQHYFDSIQAIHLASPIKPNSTKPLLHTQGVCKPCHHSCLTCKEGRESDCYQCASGFERKGDLCEKQMIWDLLDPDVMKHLAWAIILCIAAILLCSVLFVIFQAKDRGRLCWRSKPNYMPDWNKGHYDGIVPHQVMDDTDGDTRTTNTSTTNSYTSDMEDQPSPNPFVFKHFYHYSPRRVENI